MMNKIVLLLLSSLVAAPAWAAEEKAAAPSAMKPAEVQVAPAAAQAAEIKVAAVTSKVAETPAAPATMTRVVIELKGTAKDTAALAAELEKDAVYKDAACSSKPAGKHAKSATITCAKADSGLMAFLAKNASANIRWSISVTPITMKTLSNTTGICIKTICGGVAGCFLKGCQGICSPC